MNDELAAVKERYEATADPLRKHDCAPVTDGAAAIVLASAQSTGRILVTRNITDFPAEMPGIRIPYTLKD